MKQHCGTIIFLFFSICSAFSTKGYAQNIKGDTIFVNTYVESQVTFPSDVEDARLTPIEMYKEIQFPISGNSILLHSKVENSKKAILIIKEGGREHSFIIVFKKDINQYDSREYNFNYKTLKLLKKHIEETAHRNTTVAVATDEVKPTGKTEKKDKIVQPVKPVDNTPDYYALLEQGNEAYKKEAYEEAISFYEKARLLKPGDDIAPIKIGQASGKLAELSRQEQLENEKKYNALKNEARNYLDQRKYEKARELFQQAKFIMPGDGYPIRQIENIDKLIAQEAEQKRLQELAIQYNNYMAEGDKAFNARNLPEAEMAYRNALSVKQYDKKALDWLKTIDELKKQKALNDELENKYAAALGVADKLFNEADYNNAITEYNNALRIFPRSYPKDKIQAVTKIIGDRIREVNRILADQRTQENERKRLLALQKQTDDKYKASVEKGATELQKNNYLLAKSFYKQAAALKPLETLPVSQLDFIDIKLGQIAFDKRKREDSIREARETEKSYEQALTQGKSYYLKEQLLQAKIAYEAASDLRPLREEPKKQLELINNKIAKIQRERELDNRFDSLTATGDSLLILKDFDQAVINYKAASLLKPLSSYPFNQLRYIKSEVKYLAEQEATRIKNEEAQKIWEAAEKKYWNEVKFLAARRRGDSAVAAKNWAEAIKAFNEALGIHPGDKYIVERLKPVQYQYDQEQLRTRENLAEQQQAEQLKEDNKSANEKRKKNKRKRNKDEPAPPKRDGS